MQIEEEVGPPPTVGTSHLEEKKWPEKVAIVAGTLGIFLVALYFLFLGPRMTVVIYGYQVDLLPKVSLVSGIQFVFWYLVATLSITAGFHRLFTHRSYKTKRWVEIAFAISGSGSWQGNFFKWIEEHRQHHQKTETDEDPYAPQVEKRGILLGYAHSSYGWMVGQSKLDPKKDLIADLRKDPTLGWINKTFLLWTLLFVLIPALIGGLISWSWMEAYSSFIWGGIISKALSQFATFQVNSLCHMVGKRAFNTKDESKDFLPVALAAMGEGNHNGHHKYEWSARHGLWKGSIDFTHWCLRRLEDVGLAWDLREPSRATVVKDLNPGFEPHPCLK